MQTKIKRSVFGTVLLASLISLVSFTGIKGGDVFEIYLNDDLVIQQFMHNDKSVKNLTLTEANYDDQLLVKFSHCGVSGKDRTLTLKDAKDNVIRKWTYANNTGKNRSMICPVKDIMDLQKTKGNITLKLCYSSAELPNGYVLAAIPKSGKSLAGR